MIKTTRWVVRNRKTNCYVEDWQYSQGYFSHRETDDIFKALDIPADHVADFFDDKNEWEYLKVDLTATICFE